MCDSNILFTGDLMSQIPLNDACMIDGEYQYTPVFDHIQSVLADADYRVGNLETPIAGEERKYSYERYIFNTPIAYAQAVKEAGIDLVSLANNHCMDRDLGGLFMTLQNLEKIGLRSIGTARSPEEREQCCFSDLNGIRVGFMAYTYGINSQHHRMYLPKGMEYAVNLIQPAENLIGSINLLEPETVAFHTERLYHVPNAIYDEVLAPYYIQIEGDISRLREHGAELVVMLLHCGGQYDDSPDAYTREVARRLINMGVDAIVCNHQHVLHPFEMLNGVPVAWCLGNFVHCNYKTPHPKMSPYSALLRLNRQHKHQ
jgi:poly-gamma-glutamate capsule biosynthesis protein CapA/YwtB (metallophosphatase superfamily)